MSFRPDTTKKIVQDMPPPGGFPTFDFNKVSRVRGPSGLQLWAIATLTIAWGFHRLGKTNKQRSGERLAEREAKYAMAPFLQAEADEFWTLRENQIREREAEVMKDVPGWDPIWSPFYSKRWVPRPIAELDINFKK